MKTKILVPRINYEMLDLQLNLDPEYGTDLPQPQLCSEQLTARHLGRLGK